MAYASKYYDPVKAHEYYMKHRKLKGRQRSRTSTAGLSEQGKAAAAEVKERLQAELKAQLKGLPRKSLKRKQLREAMQERYAQELEKIRQDQGLVAQPKARAAKQPKAKSGGKTNKNNQNQTKTSKNKQIDQTAAKKAVKQMQEQIDKLKEKIAGLSDDQKKTLKVSLQAIIDQLKEQQKKTKKKGLTSEGKKLLKSAEKINATTD